MFKRERALREAGNNFCNTTSLHGWFYLANERGFIGKSFWILALIGSSSLALYCLVINYQEYVSLPPTSYIESTTAPLDDIPFPTVYLTNIVQVQKSFWAQINASDENWRLLLSEYVQGRDSPLSKKEEELVETYENRIDRVFNWTADKSFYDITSMKCSDLIIYARYGSYPEKAFFDSTSSHNDWGKKCTIQPFLDYINPGTKDRMSSNMDGNAWFLADELGQGFAKSAIHNGLTLLLDIEEFEYGELRLGTMGIFLTANLATSNAKISEKAIIALNGHESHIAINPKVTTTTPDALSFYEPELRDCYIEDEFELKLLATERGFTYTKSNCVNEGIVQATIEFCNCFPAFGWTAFRKPEGMETCKGLGITCALKIISEPTKNPMDVHGTRKKCLGNCHEVDFKVDVQTHGQYPSANTFFLKRDSCYVLQKIVRVCRNPWKRLSFQEKYNQLTCQQIISLHESGPRLCQNLTHLSSKNARNYPKIYDLIIQYTKDNIAHVKVFISDPYYTKIVRDVRYSFISFIGNTGGLMGLCIGMSFISLLEIIFHCFTLSRRLILS